MKEVIAKRKGGLFLLYGICFLAGVLGFVRSFKANADDNSRYGKFGLTVIGLVLIVCSLIICIRYLCTPREVITYDGNKLTMGKVEFLPTQITNVTYRRAHARNVQYRWGKITVHICGQQITYNFVADVEEVHNRLISFMREAPLT